mgnify:CR=1 FL=1
MKRFMSVAMAVIMTAALCTASLVGSSASAVSSSALSIAPKKNYVIDPGDSVKDKLVIRNLDAAAPLELTMRVVDFTYTDDGGTPKLLLDPKVEQTTWSLKPYITLPEMVTIPAGGTKSVDMSVAIPENRGAGSLYSAIVYSTGAGGADNMSNVGLSASGVTLVFATIPGKVNEDLRIEKFGPYSKESRAYMGYFNVAEPQAMAYTLKNNGNVAEAPVGSITLKGWFGKEYRIDEVNPAKSLALIGQTRRFEACIKAKEQEEKRDSNVTPTTCISPGLWPGLGRGYDTATADLYYGQNGNPTQEIIKTVGFWYLPWWFIAVLMVVLAVAAFYIWKLVRKIRHALYGPQGKTRKKASRR